MRKWMIVGALLVAPATAFAQKVNVDSDRNAPFAQFRTYAWTAGTPSANPLAENRIRAAVGSQLAAHGFTLSASPDVFVATIVLAQAKMNKAVAKMFEQYPPTQK